jgi:hypothetical protein
MIPAPLHAQLRAVSLATGISQATLVAQALRLKFLAMDIPAHAAKGT